MIGENNVLKCCFYIGSRESLLLVERVAANAFVVCAGIALRVPTPNVSVVDLVVQVEKKTLAEEVNEAFRQAAANELNGILAVSDVPLVSRDFALSDVSTTIDSSLTMVMVSTQPPSASPHLYVWAEGSHAYRSST